MTLADGVAGAGWFEAAGPAGALPNLLVNAEGAAPVDTAVRAAPRSFDPALLQPGDAVEHRPAGSVVDAVGNEVAVAFELELVIRLRMGQ